MYLTIKIINVKIIEKWVFLVFFKKIKSVFLCTPKRPMGVRVPLGTPFFIKKRTISRQWLDENV